MKTCGIPTAMQEEQKFSSGTAPVSGNSSPDTEKKKKPKKELLWSFLFVIIAVCSILAIASQGKNFSFSAFVEFLSATNPLYMSAAVLSMFGFILFEAMALRCACRSFHHPARLHSVCSYSAADIYFSAITPSASGGQPASALLMIRDGIPANITAAVLFLNLTMYCLAILAIGLVCFFLKPDIFLRFDTTSRVLIVIGYTVQIGLALFFFLLVRSERLLESICQAILNLLEKLHLVRHPEKKREKLRNVMERYGKSAAMLSGQKHLVLQTFFFNLLQRASQISVTMFVFLAAYGGSFRQAADIWTVQSYTVIGSNCIPIPGAMGVFDYLLLNGLESFLPSEQAVCLELASRSVSFYSCIILCGIIVFLTWKPFRKDHSK